MGRWGGDRGGPKSFASSEQKQRNAAAANEGRAVYVRGIPPDWSKEQLTDFFSHQGTVESVNLMPPKPGQNARAAFVNFETPEDAENAAEVCDNLPVDSAESGPGSFKLVCSLKRAPGKKVDMVSGFSDLSKARQDRRAVYISGLPIGYTPADVRQLLQGIGVVEDVKELPATRNQSCFAIMSSPEEASEVIERMDGKLVAGKQISVSYPQAPKRTRDPGSSTNVVVEVRGFPHDALPTEVASIIESGGREVQTVKMLRHGSLQNFSVAVVHLSSIEDAQAVVEELSALEITPGTKLQATIKGSAEAPFAVQDTPAMPQLQDAGAYGSQQGGDTQQMDLDGPRNKGEIVGRLLQDGPAAASASKGRPIMDARRAASVGAGKGPSVPSARESGVKGGASAIGRSASAGARLPTSSKAAPPQVPPLRHRGPPPPPPPRPSAAPHVRGRGGGK